MSAAELEAARSARAARYAAATLAAGGAACPAPPRPPPEDRRGDGGAAAAVSVRQTEHSSLGEAARALLARGFLPIPASGKTPGFHHKGGKWTRDSARRGLNPSTSGPGGREVAWKPTLYDNYSDLAILCDNVLILDFDSRAEVDVWRALAPTAFGATVASTTVNGVHFWWTRSALCEALGLFDGPCGGARGPDGCAKFCAVDVKTVCATGSFGLCNVPPADGRRWLRSPFDGAPLLALPDAVARHVMEMRRQHTGGGGGGGGAKRKRASSGNAGAAAADNDVIVLD